MYCSSCGSQVSEGLKYCNTCGGRIAQPEAEDSRGSIVDSLSKAVAWVAVVGVVAFLALVKLVIDSDLISEHKAFIPAAFLFTLLAICFLLIRQMSRGSQPGKKEQEVLAAPPVGMPRPQTNRLEPSTERPASVVENTTRTLDEVYSERK